MAQHFDNAVIEELGDPIFDLSLGEDQAQHIGIHNMDSHHREAIVDLEEFPWVTGSQWLHVGKVSMYLTR